MNQVAVWNLKFECCIESTQAKQNADIRPVKQDEKSKAADSVTRTWKDCFLHPPPLVDSSDDESNMQAKRSAPPNLADLYDSDVPPLYDHNTDSESDSGDEASSPVSKSESACLESLDDMAPKAESSGDELPDMMPERQIKAAFIPSPELIAKRAAKASKTSAKLAQLKANNQCNYCMDSCDLSACVCGKVKYCSKACQKAAWKGHKAACKASRPEANATPIVTARKKTPAFEAAKMASTNQLGEALLAAAVATAPAPKPKAKRKSRAAVAKALAPLAGQTSDLQSFTTAASLENKTDGLESSGENNSGNTFQTPPKLTKKEKGKLWYEARKKDIALIRAAEAKSLAASAASNTDAVRTKITLRSTCEYLTLLCACYPRRSSQLWMRDLLCRELHWIAIALRVRNRPRQSFRQILQKQVKNAWLPAGHPEIKFRKIGHRHQQSLNQRRARMRECHSRIMTETSRTRSDTSA